MGPWGCRMSGSVLFAGRGSLNPTGWRLFFLRATTLFMVVGMAVLVGCHSSEYDENTRKAKRMTELFDRDEKYLGVPLQVGQVEFRENANVYTAKLSVFLRGTKGILDKPGSGGKPGKDGKLIAGKGQELEIATALSGGKESAQNSADAPYGFVYLLDPKSKDAKNARIDAILVLVRHDKTGDHKDRAKLVGDLAKLRITKNFDPEAKEGVDKFMGPKKLDPTFKDWFSTPIKTIPADEIFADAPVTLPDGRQAVWFTYLVPLNQKKPAKFAGTMAVCYRVIRSQPGPAGTSQPSGNTKGKATAAKDSDLVFDNQKKRFKAPQEVELSIKNLRLDADKDSAMELYNLRPSTTPGETAPAPSAAGSANKNSK